MTAKEIIEKLSKVNKDFTVVVNSIWTDLPLEIDSVEIDSFGIIFKLDYNGKIITVKQFIEELSKYDQDSEVLVAYDYDVDSYDTVIDLDICKKSVVLGTH